jgi:hypothetical protein
MDRNLEVYIKAWNCLRLLNEAACANEGFCIIKEMCDDCVGDRNTACNTRKDLHVEIDKIEEQMPRNIMMEKYTFERTKIEKDRLLLIETKRLDACGSCGLPIVEK